MRRGLASLVTPIAEDDLEADPIHAFSVEWRRTIAAIRYCEEEIKALQEAMDDSGEDSPVNPIFWGKVEQKDVNSGEWPGTDTTYRAALNMIEIKRQWERQHLADLTKIYVSAKLDERSKKIGAALSGAIDDILRSVIIGLAQDPNDPAVRAVVNQAFAQIGAKAQPQVIEGEVL